MLQDEKKKWKKKIKNNFQGFGSRIVKILEKQSLHGDFISDLERQEQNSTIKKYIHSKYEIQKINLMKSTQKICDEERKWLR